MQCIILAAGYATRLYPLTEHFPKPLLSVGNYTILDRLLNDIRDTVRPQSVTVVTNRRFAPLFETWRKQRGDAVRILDDGTDSNETRLGAVRDIDLAYRLHPDEDALVMAGDNILDFSLAGFVKFARLKGTSCVMCHPETNPERLRKTAVITLDPDSRIISYVEKPTDPQGTMVVPPFYYLTAKDAGRIPEALAQGVNPDAPGFFGAWLSGVTPMHAWRMPGRRYDIGDFKTYAEALVTFLGR